MKKLYSYLETFTDDAKAWANTHVVESMIIASFRLLCLIATVRAL